MPPAPKAPVAKKQKAAGPVETVKWPFGKRNYIFFGIAAIVVIAGYVLLAQGDISMAPLLLVVGYCVLIPVAIMVKDPDLHGKQTASAESAE